jgi:hypothetical protein
MADKNSLIQFAVEKVGAEQLQQMVDQAEQELSKDPDVTKEALDELVKQLNYVAENPEAYKDVVTSAIQAGMIDPEDVPPEFDPMFIAVMLIAVTELSHRVVKQGSQMFARGGLAQQAKHLAAQGRGGDTMLAHINPREAEVLRRMGGSGTINPNTGLHEFKGGIFKSIGKIFKSVAKIAIPVVANIIAPGWGGALAGAAMGAMGGGGLKGALLGGLSGAMVPGVNGGAGGFLAGAAKSVGSSVSSFLPKFITDNIGAQTLGAGLLGGAASAALGQGFLPGALTAGGVSSIAPTIGGLANSAKGLLNSTTAPGGIFSSQAGGTGVNLGSSGGLNQVGGSLLGGESVNAAGAQVAKDAIAANAAAGIPGFSNAVSQGAATNAIANASAPGITLPRFDMGAAIKDSAGNFAPSLTDVAAANTGGIAGPAASTGILGTGISGSNALMGLTMLGGLTPPQALQQIQGSEMSPEHKEAMSRALTNYTAKYNMVTLPNQGTPEYDDMMNNISQGIGVNFMNPTITNDDTGMTRPMKRGGKAKAPAGGLSQMAMLAQGTGSGRDDTINAKLSDGEYVIDAETVALLGNGSTKAGAAVLDQMREQIRQQKGKALAKGKFSPNAKSPLAYMKGGLK